QLALRPLLALRQVLDEPRRRLVEGVLLLEDRTHEPLEEQFEERLAGEHDQLPQAETVRERDRLAHVLALLQLQQPAAHLLRAAGQRGRLGPPLPHAGAYLLQDLGDAEVVGRGGIGHDEADSRSVTDAADPAGSRNAWRRPAGGPLTSPALLSRLTPTRPGRGGRLQKKN